MKAVLSIFGAILVIISSASALAAFSTAELHTASQAAVSDFESANPEHAPHLNGYKVWKSDEDAKVKVYVSHEGMEMEFNYLCMKHGSSIMCHAE